MYANGVIILIVLIYDMLEHDKSYIPKFIGAIMKHELIE